MTADTKILQQILDIEWDMFHSVRNIGGPAACQQDRPTFEVMRSSQIGAWPPEVARSYLDDLLQAVADGRNLMAEKYARMMEHTSPLDFHQRIAPTLPPLESGAPELVEKIAGQAVTWQEELAAKYPSLVARGRPIRASADRESVTSFETYIRGELSTYSLRTLRLLEDHYRRATAEGRNFAEEVLRLTLTRYGFDSLDKAEAAQKAHDTGRA